MSLAAVSSSSPKAVAAISSPGPLRVPSENARAATELPDRQPSLAGTARPSWRPHNRLLKLTGSDVVGHLCVDAGSKSAQESDRLGQNDFVGARLPQGSRAGSLIA